MFKKLSKQPGKEKELKALLEKMNIKLLGI